MEERDSNKVSQSNRGDYRLLAFVEGFNVAKETREEDWVPVWPHLVFRELVAMLLVTLVLIVVSLIFNAPLEEPANPTHSPNPAKAPWYFLGLQELLVYFDPWIAGVVLPGIIMIGLMVIPYLDQNPRYSGGYAFSRRRFPIVIFTFGLALWFALISVGGFFRGPGWEWYWPWEDHSVEKMTLHGTENLSLMAGGLLVLLYFGLGLIIPAILKKDFYRRVGPIKYTVMTSLILLMFGVLGKIVLRLVFNIKYVVVTPWFNI